MKRFIYYNQDSVNSLLAQIEKGILQKEKETEEDSLSNSNTMGITADLTGDLSAKVFGIGASLQGDLGVNDSNTDVTTKLINKVHEKVLHDYAFERVFSYLNNNNLINNESPNIGDYVLLNETPTFLDFDYFASLFDDSGAMKFSIDQNKKKILDLKRNIPQNAKVPPEIKAQIKEIEDAIKTSEEERKDTKNTIEVFKNTLPYNRCVMTSNMLIPCDDSNFRDDPSIIAFKYGGKMSILGYITNIITKESANMSNNDFAQVFDTVNTVMLNIFKNTDCVYIVHPIALFY